MTTFKNYADLSHHTENYLFRLLASGHGVRSRKVRRDRKLYNKQLAKARRQGLDMHGSDYFGIDYAYGGANIDKETGIRFGVIPINDLNEWAWESFESDYGDPTCPECGSVVVEWESEKHDDYADPKHGCCDYACETCEASYDSEQCFGEEPVGHILDDGGYKAIMHGDDGDVFILKSPYYTHAQFCSPCAPGACHLRNPVSLDGPKCYCFGHEWFSEKQAPYAVFRVSDGSLVMPGDDAT